MAVASLPRIFQSIVYMILTGTIPACVDISIGTTVMCVA